MRAIGYVALACWSSTTATAWVAIPGASKPHRAEESGAAMQFHLTGKELARALVSKHAR